MYCTPKVLANTTSHCRTVDFFRLNQTRCDDLTVFINLYFSLDDYTSQRFVLNELEKFELSENDIVPYKFIVNSLTQTALFEFQKFLISRMFL